MLPRHQFERAVNEAQRPSSAIAHVTGRSAHQAGVSFGVTRRQLEEQPEAIVADLIRMLRSGKKTP